jgi:tetratricopeptide (TPR) repeat protein
MQTKFIFFILFCLYCISSSTFGRTRQNSYSQTDSLYSTLSKRIEQVHEDDLSKLQLTKEEIKTLFSDANQIVSQRETSVNCWMWVLGILVTLGSIVPSIIIFLFGRSFFNYYKEEKQRLIEDFRLTSERIAKELENKKQEMDNHLEKINIDANLIISNLKSQEQEGSRLSRKLLQLGKINENNDKEKFGAINEAREISSNNCASDFQKRLAIAYDKYYSNQWNDAIDHFLLVIKEDINNLTAAQLAVIYFKLADSYFQINHYDDSIKYNKKCIELLPNDCKSYINLSYSFLNKFKIDFTDIESLEQADSYSMKAEEAGRHQYHGRLASLKGDIATMKQKYDHAIQIYQDAIAKENHESDILSKIECLIYNNNLVQASKELQNFKNWQPQKCFETDFIQILLDIINQQSEKTPEQYFQSLRTDAGTSFNTTDWDLSAFRQWIKSDYSNFVSSSSKSKLIQLSQLLSQWENTNIK